MPGSVFGGAMKRLTETGDPGFSLIFPVENSSPWTAPRTLLFQAGHVGLPERKGTPMTKTSKFALGPDAVRAFVENHRSSEHGPTPDDFPEGSFIAIATMDAPYGEEGEVVNFELIGLNGQAFDVDGFESEFMSPFQGEVVMRGVEYRRDAAHVLFRADNEGEITAVFPFLQGAPGMAQCYARIGQHGSCDMGWVAETRAATEEEAAPLKAELENHPFDYALIVIKDLTSLAMEEPVPAPEGEQPSP
jgi:hypothetical protein